MQIVIEPSDEFTVVNGARVRQWLGITEHGVRVRVFVNLIACHESEDQSEFERVLQAIAPPPESEQRTIPLRMLL